MPLPIHNYTNVFTMLEIAQPLIAIDKENYHYLRLDERDLKNCIQENITYTCE